MKNSKNPQWLNLTAGIIAEAIAIIYIYRYYTDPVGWKLIIAILWAVMAFGWYRAWLKQKKNAKREAQGTPPV